MTTGARHPPFVRPGKAAEFAVDLIEGKRQEIGELQKGDRPPAGQRPADGDADDGRLAEWRIGHAVGKGGAQPARDAENVALRILYVLAIKRNPPIPPHIRGQRLAQRAGHRKAHALTGATVFAIAAGKRAREGGLRMKGSLWTFMRERPVSFASHLGLDDVVQRLDRRLINASLGQKSAKLRQRVGSHASLPYLAGRAVHGFVVGVGMVRQPRDTHDAERRSASFTNGPHKCTKRSVAGDRIAAVDAMDIEAVKRVCLSARRRIEGLATGFRGNRIGIILDQK